MIKILPEHLKIVKKILSETAPNCEARVFGSRVNGNPKDYSDLDIALASSERLSLNTLGKIEEAFEESDIPFRVDILDWNALSPEFQELIAKNCETL